MTRSIATVGGLKIECEYWTKVPKSITPLIDAWNHCSRNYKFNWTAAIFELSNAAFRLTPPFDGLLVKLNVILQKSLILIKWHRLAASHNRVFFVELNTHNPGDSPVIQSGESSLDLGFETKDSKCHMQIFEKRPRTYNVSTIVTIKASVRPSGTKVDCAKMVQDRPAVCRLGQDFDWYHFWPPTPTQPAS